MKLLRCPEPKCMSTFPPWVFFSPCHAHRLASIKERDGQLVLVCAEGTITSVSFALVVGERQMKVVEVIDPDGTSDYQRGMFHLSALDPTTQAPWKREVSRRLLIEAGQADSEIIRID